MKLGIAAAALLVLFTNPSSANEKPPNECGAQTFRACVPSCPAGSRPIGYEDRVTLDCVAWPDDPRLAAITSTTPEPATVAPVAPVVAPAGLAAPARAVPTTPEVTG